MAPGWNPETGDKVRLMDAESAVPWWVDGAVHETLHPDRAELAGTYEESVEIAEDPAFYLKEEDTK